MTSLDFEYKIIYIMYRLAYTNSYSWTQLTITRHWRRCPYAWDSATTWQIRHHDIRVSWLIRTYTWWQRATQSEPWKRSRYIITTTRCIGWLLISYHHSKCLRTVGTIHMQFPIRPNISYATKVLARRINAPTTPNEKCLKHLLR